MPQAAHVLTFPVDHIIARQHGGETTFDNLALSCVRLGGTDQRDIERTLAKPVAHSLCARLFQMSWPEVVRVFVTVSELGNKCGP